MRHLLLAPQLWTPLLPDPGVQLRLPSHVPCSKDLFRGVGKHLCLVHCIVPAQLWPHLQATA
eukprot:9966571-Prorocentrum_lima.AAC.1